MRFAYPCVLKLNSFVFWHMGHFMGIFANPLSIWEVYHLSFGSPAQYSSYTGLSISSASARSSGRAQVKVRISPLVGNRISRRLACRNWRLTTPIGPP